MQRMRIGLLVACLVGAWGGVARADDKKSVCPDCPQCPQCPAPKEAPKNRISVGLGINSNAGLVGSIMLDGTPLSVKALPNLLGSLLPCAPGCQAPCPSQAVAAPSPIQVKFTVAEMESEVAAKLGFTPSNHAPGEAVVKSSAQLDLLRKLRGKSVRVLAEPVLLLLNDQSGKFQMGGEIPVVQGTAHGQGLAYRFYGMALQCKPRRLANGCIQLELEQELSTPDGKGLNTRKWSSTCELHPGQTGGYAFAATKPGWVTVTLATPECVSQPVACAPVPPAAAPIPVPAAYSYPVTQAVVACNAVETVPTKAAPSVLHVALVDDSLKVTGPGTTMTALDLTLRLPENRPLRLGRMHNQVHVVADKVQAVADRVSLTGKDPQVVLEGNVKYRRDNDKGQPVEARGDRMVIDLAHGTVTISGASAVTR